MHVIKIISHLFSSIKSNLSFLFILISFSQTWAQFTPSTRRGCAPLTVTLTENTGGGINILYDFGAGGGIINSNSYTYTTPGRYYITQYYSYMGQGKIYSDPNYIEVLPTPPPTFQVETCENKEAVITITDTNYEEYLIDFENNGTYDQTVLKGSAPIKHTYAASQNYQVKIKGNYMPGNCGNESSATIRTYDKLIKPSISKLEVINNSTIQLSFTPLISYLKYKILQKIGNGNYTSIGNLPTPLPSSYTINALSTAIEQYSYKLIAYNECGTELASDEISSFVLDAAATDNKNIIGWLTTSSPTFTDYEIYKNGNLIFTSSDPNKSMSIDIDVSCNKDYCYQLITKFSNAISLSNIDCVKGISKTIPPKIENTSIYAIEDNTIAIQIEIPSMNGIQKFQLIKNGGTELVDEFQILKKEIALNQKYDNCYRIQYIDSCGNLSEISNPICLIQLSGQSVNSQQNTINWTAYTGWQIGIKEYIVQKLDESNSVYAEYSVGTNLSYTDIDLSNDPQIIRYRIKAISASPNLFVTYSTIFEFVREMEVFLPDAFSPNNDGRNDLLEIKGKFIKNIKITFFNNWGEPIFETNDLSNSWNGKLNGNLVPFGPYTYLIQAEDFTKKKIVKRGTILLVK